MQHQTTPSPSINPQWLTLQVLDKYPVHKESILGEQLIAELVSEYLRFWKLIRMFPTNRIVGTGPIIAVQRVHWSFRETYFSDCMAYFNRYLFEEMSWGGRFDVRGTIETVRAYQDTYNRQPPEPWQDITQEYQLGRAHLRVV